MKNTDLLYHLAAAGYITKEAIMAGQGPGPGMGPGADPMANLVPNGVGVKAPPGTGSASTDIHQVLGDAVARGGSANIKIDGAPKVQPQPHAQVQPAQNPIMGAPSPGMPSPGMPQQGSPVNMAGQAPGGAPSRPPGM